MNHRLTPNGELVKLALDALKACDNFYVLNRRTVEHNPADPSKEEAIEHVKKLGYAILRHFQNETEARNN